jgi:WD repeat-containing protein 35
MCESAVSLYLKLGNISEAVKLCINLNEWSKAIEIAKTYEFAGIEDILQNHAEELSITNKWKVVELYRKADQCLKSAKVLYDLAKEAEQRKKPLIEIKQIYVLAAREMERHHQLRQKNSKNAHESVIVIHKGKSSARWAFRGR